MPDDTVSAAPRPQVSYRGVQVDQDLAAMIRYMPVVDATRESLQGLQGVWDSLSLLSEMSGTGVEVSSIRAAFASLTSTLVNETGRQARHAVSRDQAAKAQVVVDILVRNLFERTADIGFLSTDEDLRAFVEKDAAARETCRPAVHERLVAYARKYTVYDDIVLLTPEGEVLARLDDRVDVPRTTDRALLDEALRTRAAYVEVYRPFDLRPGQARTLVYACRVMDLTDTRPVGVLCLTFRFEDEAELIFRKFVGADDWSVVAILDADGVAIASSDRIQVPVGSRVGAPADGAAHAMRFAGQRWMAVSCDPHRFQGYAGPGWRGHSMTPLEHAFDDDGDAREPVLDPSVAEQLRESRVLHPDSLRAIAQSARRVEGDLARAVWNGNLALVAAAADGVATGSAGGGNGAGVGFSRSLLREIGRTGARTRDGFTQALSQMSAAVARSTLSDAQACAALAIDVMDRSLYERANDCRWWALTTAFRSALETSAVPDATALAGVLRRIHALYTVYADLVLFDRDGRVVAASVADGPALPGAAIEAEWVQRTLRLGDPQDYCVSAFEPSALYGGRPTYVYAAAVRGLARPSQVVGGIAIVFDSEPQFRSMLHDTLPQDESGEPVPGAFGVYVEARGRVIACSDATLAPGMSIGASVPADDRASILAWNGRWYAVGAASSTGYREFKGPADPYDAEVRALVFEALAEAGDDARPAPTAVGQAGGGGGAPAAPRRGPPPGTIVPADKRVDLATVRIGSQWHALPGGDLVEAVRPDRIVPLPARSRYVHGCLMYRNQPIAVIDPRALLGEPATASAEQVVVLRPADGRTPMFGLLVDALGDNPVVSADHVVRLSEGVWHRTPSGAVLIDSVVTAGAGTSAGAGADRTLLTMLSVAGLAALL